MLGNLFKKKQQKVVVLGLDGVPCTLLKRFAGEGVMPNVAGLLAEGTLTPMSASLPEVSSTSWSTFMTGVNPGRHGIYGFMELRKDDYGWKFPNSGDLKSRTLWEIAGDSRKRSIVLNIPSTYPARPMNGMLVAGFVALDLAKASYPGGFHDYLRKIGYRLDVDAGKAVSAVEAFKEDILHTFRKRVEAIDHLYENEEWDLFIAAITETDRLHHYLWDACDDEGSPHHRFFLDFYRELDAFIGHFRRKVGSVPFIMLSDHGFTAIKKEVYLNRFLMEREYLGFTTSDPESLEGMSGESRAFALDPSRVYIHLKGKFPRGSVDLRDFEKVRTSVRDDLLALRDDAGNKVIREVCLKEDIYSGACLAEAPDLVVLPFDGYDLKGSLRKKELFGNGPLTGGHTRDNATFYINKKIDCASPNIADVGATVLSLLGIDTGALDGKALA